MPVPTTIDQLSTTAASNYPQGTDSPSTIDDTQRAHGAFIRQLQTGAVATTANITAGTISGVTSLTTTGNVGVGTATPNLLGSGTAVSILGSTTNRGLVELGSTSVTASGVFGQLSGYNGNLTLAGAIQFAGAGATDSGDIRIFTKQSGSAITERMRIDSSGNVLIGVTAATSGGAVLETADGITFPSTQVASANANTLDDYEEGTFTPTIAGTTTAGAGTYTAQVGRYTKVGNRVICTVNLVWTAHTGTGNMQVNGLPFTSNSTVNNNPNFALYANNLTITGQLFGVLGTNGTIVTLQSVNNGAASALAIDTAAQVAAEFTYEV